MIKSLFKITYKKNILKYVMLGIVYILLFVCLLSVLTFNTVATELVEKTVLANACNNHISIRSVGNERFIDSSVTDKLIDDNINAVTEIFGVTVKDEKDSDIGIIGLDFDKFKNLGINVIQKTDTDNGMNSLVISKSMSDIKKMKLNDIIRIKNQEGEIFECKIIGIAEDTSFLVQNSGALLMDLNSIRTIWNKPDKITSAYIQLKDMNVLDKTYLNIGNTLEEYNVTVVKLIDKDQYDFYVQPVKIMLLIFSVLAGILAIFIAYYTFKKLLDDRMPQYGKLLSLGATKLKLILFMAMETLIFTLIISVIGSIISILFISFLLTSFVGIGAISFNIGYAVMLFVIFSIFTLAMVFAIAYKNMNKGIVSLIKGSSIKANTGKRKFYYICIALAVAFILIAIGIGCLFITGITAQIIGLILFISGISVLIFNLVYLSIKGSKKIASNILPKSVGILTKAENSIMNNKGNIFIIITLTILISVVSVTKPLIMQSVGNFYSDIDLIVHSAGNPYTENDFQSADGNINTVYKSYTAKQKIDDNSITFIGVNTGNYKNYTQETFKDDLDGLMLKLNSNERQVLVSTIYLKGNGKAVGDNLIVETKNGKAEYTIIGSFETFDNQGKNFILNEEVFFNDFVTEMTQFYITVEENTVNSVMENISNNELFKNRIMLSKTHDIVKSNAQNAHMIITIIEILIAVLCVLSAICWFINMFINIKADMTTFIAEMTLGKSRRRTVTETAVIYIGIIGLTVSLLASLFAGVANYFIINILSYSVGSFGYKYSVSGFSILFIVLTVAIGVILPIINLLRKNPIKVIKGEL